ncbi:MAG: hypothetical protein WCW01_04100 [Gammaproteobacteria bacterium]
MYYHKSNSKQKPYEQTLSYVDQNIFFQTALKAMPKTRQKNARHYRLSEPFEDSCLSSPRMGHGTLYNNARNHRQSPSNSTIPLPQIISSPPSTPLSTLLLCSPPSSPPSSLCTVLDHESSSYTQSQMTSLVTTNAKTAPIELEETSSSLPQTSGVTKAEAASDFILTPLFSITPTPDTIPASYILIPGPVEEEKPAAIPEPTSSTSSTSPSTFFFPTKNPGAQAAPPSKITPQPSISRGLISTAFRKVEELATMLFHFGN